MSFFQCTVNEIIDKYELCSTYTYLDNIIISGINKSDHDAKLKALIEAVEAEKLKISVFLLKSEIESRYRVSHLKIQAGPDICNSYVN